MSGAFRHHAYLVPVSPEDVKANHPGFTFGVYHDPPGQVWADFVHDEDEFVVVAEGQIEIEVAGEAALCTPGDLVRIPAGSAHSLSTPPSAGSVWLYGYGRFRGVDG